MVNKRMRPTQALQVVRKAARKQGLTVEALPGGKGSHEPYGVFNANGQLVGTFGVTGHQREMSWHVMHSIEDGLVHLFDEKWMEK